MRGSGGYLFPAILGLFLLCLVIVIHGIFSLAVFGCCGGRDHDPCCVRYSAGYSLCSSYCYTLLLFLGWDPPYWWWDMVGQPCVKPQFWDWEVAQPGWTSSGNEMCPVELSRLLGLTTMGLALAKIYPADLEMGTWWIEKEEFQGFSHVFTKKSRHTAWYSFISNHDTFIKEKNLRLLLGGIVVILSTVGSGVCLVMLDFDSEAGWIRDYGKGHPSESKSIASPNCAVSPSCGFKTIQQRPL